MSSSKKRKEAKPSEELREYTVAGYLTISVVKTIMAKNEKEAREKAKLLVAPSLCHQCASAGDGDEEAWELNGFDDPPDDAVQHVERYDDDA